MTELFYAKNIRNLSINHKFHIAMKKPNTYSLVHRYSEKMSMRHDSYEIEAHNDADLVMGIIDTIENKITGSANITFEVIEGTGIDTFDTIKNYVKAYKPNFKVTKGERI